MSTEDRSKPPRPVAPEAPAPATPDASPDGQAPGTAPANPATTPSEVGGMVTPQGAPPPKADKKSVESFATQKGHVGPDAWKLAAARAYHGWALGAQVTEFDYDAAVDAAATVALR